MIWIEVVCITVLGAIAIAQTISLRRIHLRLWDSTALLVATVNVVDMDEESKQVFMEQIEENKRWM